MITLELSHPRQGLITSPAFPPPAGVVDTLGAGDTFNATVIFVFANVDIAISTYVSVLSEFTNFQKRTSSRPTAKFINELCKNL